MHILKRHECYTDAKVREIESKRAREKRMRVGAFIACGTFVMSFFWLWIFGRYVVNRGVSTDAVILCAVVCLFGAFITYATTVFLRSDDRPEECIDVLQTFELQWIKEMSDAHPEVAKAVGVWRGEGKTLRSRDMYAICGHLLHVTYSRYDKAAMDHLDAISV